MLNKLCLADGIGLVNIVRSQEQEDTLRALGCGARLQLDVTGIHAMN